MLRKKDTTTRRVNNKNYTKNTVMRKAAMRAMVKKAWAKCIFPTSSFRALA